MILESGSRATLGLVRVRLWRAVLTRRVGSLMKCLEDMVMMVMVVMSEFGGVGVSRFVEEERGYEMGRMKSTMN